MLRINYCFLKLQDLKYEGMFWKEGMFNFSDEMEITLYGFIAEGRGMGPQDFRKKGKNELKLPQP